MAADLPGLLVVGGGYCGQAVAHHWKGEGQRAWLTSRDPARAAAYEAEGLWALTYRFDTSDALQTRVIDPTLGAALLTFPPSEGLRHERDALAWVAAQGIQRALVLSSTSVYGASGGAEVDDDTPAAPTDERGVRRLASEEAMREAADACGVSLCVLRLTGIYGPGRSYRARMAAGQVQLVDEGAMWTNRIFVDDVVSALRHLLARPRWERPHYVVSDGHPFRVRELVAYVCERWSLPWPPSVALETIPPARRAFWEGDRRVIPRALLAEGWSPLFSDFRAGYEEAWRREEVGAARP